MTWRYPYLLLLLAVLVLLALVWSYRQHRRGQILNTVHAPLLDHLLSRFDRQKQRWKQRLVFLGLTFLIIGAAGPQIGIRVKPVERKGVDLVFAIDVSLSMNAADVKPNRLVKAKYEIAQMIKQLKGDRVALIVFAGSSHLYLPLTTDYEAARLFLDNIDTHMIPTQGTALSTALQTALTAFAPESEKYKVLILVTDGEDHEGQAVELARQAARQGIVIHTVGVGTVTGSLIPLVDENGRWNDYKRDREGKLVTSVLNENLLREIAQAGNGIFVRFDNRLASHRALLKAIDAMEKRTVSTHEFSEYEDRYQVFAVLALAFFVAAFLFPTRRRPDQVWRGRFV
jgi:Ca-activated chloride channel family protein